MLIEKYHYPFLIGGGSLLVIKAIPFYFRLRKKFEKGL